MNRAEMRRKDPQMPEVFVWQAAAFGTATKVTENAEKIEVLRILCQRHTPINMWEVD